MFNTGLEGDPLIGQTQYTELGHKEPIVQVLYIMYIECVVSNDYLLKKGENTK